MLKYCIIQLSDSSVSFCHYTSGNNRSLIPLTILKDGILWSVKHRLNIQIAYPDYILPIEYTELLNQYPHVRISHENDIDADISVINGWSSLLQLDRVYENPIILHTSFKDFIANHKILAVNLQKFSRVNIIFTDVANFSDSNIEEYEKVLITLSDVIYIAFLNGSKVQLNLITDRIMLSHMNNCNAGDEVITIAPNGRFYPCPAFYLNAMNDIGSLANGLDIPNSQLYRLQYAPICRKCDAFHCKRCVMLNKQLTMEINTPGHQQCIMAHTERKVARLLLEKLRNLGNVFPEVNIPEIDYNDPFDIIIR